MWFFYFTQSLSLWILEPTCLLRNWDGKYGPNVVFAENDQHYRMWCFPKMAVLEIFTLILLQAASYFCSALNKCVKELRFREGSAVVATSITPEWNKWAGNLCQSWRWVAVIELKVKNLGWGKHWHTEQSARIALSSKPNVDCVCVDTGEKTPEPLL